ncbi:MAG: ABC transporter ATP-binding protein [Chloroflexi bacterium]|nr:MAG: ABC transporter ATP-binding protein [Chloroflexota bacterium]
MSHLLEAHNLVKHYGRHTVIDHVSLDVSPGEIVALIGPNGAGKSTTLEVILGLRAADGGKVVFWREDPLGEIGIQLQATPFFRGLTTAENLRLFASFYGVRLTQAQIVATLERCGLAGATHTEAAKLSGGQKKRLAIALTLAHSPRLLFLDEPTAALDPHGRHDIRALVRSLASTGVAVVFTSHDMEEVGKLADRVVLIVEGQVRADGTPTDLLARFGAPTLEDLYLELTVDKE